MKQRVERIISTLRERARRKGIIRKTVGLGLAIMMVIETPSWSGLIKSALAHEDKVGSGRCIYVDTSLIGADSDVMESGIGAYVYNRDGSSYSDAPIIMEKVEGKRNVYQLVLDDYYTYVEFTKGSDLNTSTKTGELAIDWSLGSPCYMFNSEALSDGGYFYGLYTVYFDLNGAPDASAFADNGVGVYAYNSDEDSYTAVPVAMKASGKGESVYEYSFDRPYDCIAFMGGYGSWNYEVATAPVYMDWSYSAPCFFLEQVDGYESAGVWRNLRYTVYFDASDIKDDEAFIENGVWLYAFNDSDDKLSEDPVKMVASSVGSYIYEYTMERPYENLQFVLGDSLEAEVSSQVLVNDWMTYAEPCYKMTLDRKEILMASPSPSMTPSASPSGSPSATPSMDPSASPSATPSTSPSATPSTTPSGSPSATPSMKPSTSPSTAPSATPSANPTVTPSTKPTEAPTTEPTEIPTIKPTEEPTAEPTLEPTQEPEPTEEPEPVEEATPEPVQDSEDNQQGTTSDDSSSDEQPQALDQARAAAELTVTYGSYKMIWVGTGGGGDIEPRTNTIESEESGDTDDTEETSTPENPPATDDSTDSEAPADTEGPATPDTSADDSDENPAPAPTTGGEADGEPMPSDDPDMISASPSATPIGTEDESVVETTMSLLSSTGATLMFQRAAALSRAGDGKVKTIYFDTSSIDWSGDNWSNSGNQMYIYLIGTDLNVMRPMKKSERSSIVTSTPKGILWEYELEVDEVDKVTAVIFAPQNNLSSGNWQQTVDVVLYTGSLASTQGSYPCYSLNGTSTSSENKRNVLYWGDLGPVSQAGKEIYFIDMTSQLETDGIVAKFGGEGLSDDEVPKDPITGGYKIPNDVVMLGQPYSTVTFYDSNGQQIGETYNFLNKATDDVKGFSYDENEMNTFYYGATEKADGTKISTWGARPSEEIVSLAGKKLYFDRIYFKVPKDTNADGGASGGTGTGDASGEGALGAQFQIGTETPVSLTADEGDARTYSYTFYGTSTATSQSILTYLDQDGTKYHFFWDKFTVESTGEDNDLVTQEYEIAKVEGKYELGNWIYFDATMSKMPNESENSHIPKEDDVVYCLMAKGSSGQDAVTLPMTKVEDRGTWKDVWKIDLPEGYTYVKFANYEIKTDSGKYANGTDYLKVPTDIFDPCFYADSGDDEIYGNNWRGGYWDEVYTIRDPEEIKDTPVVDIRQEDYTRNSKRLYVKTTLYDYYTDYELNGNNRDEYSYFKNNEQRSWVTFRQFDQALSKYYEEAGEPIPIYTGHFQPDIGGAQFSDIAGKLDLYGYGDYGRFFSTNNSGINIYGNASDYATVAQGLVANELRDDQLYASGNQVTLPYFNEDFLAGNNSKNAVLGKVYEDVSFPFELEENYYSNEPGVSYWVYDSNKKSLEMKQTADGEYYLQEYTNKPAWSENRNSAGTKMGHYGFFPFNSGSSDTGSYNYGFGAKLEINFRLTEDGKVDMAGEGNPKADIKFDFSGDDDVWVFIDGHLALDMGGAHAASHGYLNFATQKAYVDNVKPSAGSTGSTELDFIVDGSTKDANGKVTYDTREHTLTMFYMERGMWESNMKISFNFPDENQLEVEKQINMDAVNDIFKSTFDGQKIFEFSIRNLATHFDSYTVDGDENTEPIEFNPDFNGVYATASANTFKSVSEHAGHSNVAYWLALQDDAGSNYKHLRYGVIPTSGGAVEAGEMKYLQFSYYYAGAGYPSLSNMYLRIETTGGTAVHKLSGKIYGSASMKRGEWSTLTVDLDKFFTGDTVNRNGILSISFGYDYPQPFYLDDFIFRPGASSHKLTGFITKQPEIPDYGTAYDSVLKIPKGAMYTRKLEGTNDSYGRIDASGTFALEDGESVLFRDQFRRGSYIELKEIGTSDVFTTTWTMYENGQPVVGMNGSSDVKSVTVADTGRSLKDQHNDANAVDDGRTERYTNDPKDGYNQGNSYNGTRPGDPVFVFRSYSDPDSDAGVTKLKVVYTNTVNVGDLVIGKSQAAGSQELTEEYRFRVTFTNIAGMGLEGDTPIVVNFKLKKDGLKEIKGIPLGTEYVIEELEPGDKSFLEGVSGPAPSDDIVYDIENRQVRGKITSAGEVASYDFSNMLKPVISVEVTKVWLDASGNEITEEDGYTENSTLPESLTIRIQRRIKGSANAEWEPVEKYKDDIKLGTGYERSWKYIFSDLEKYVDNTDPAKGMYEYRVVEVDDKGKIVPDGGFWGSFQASYENQIISGKLEDIPNEDELYTSTITNIHTVSLKVKKVDGSGKPLGGVAFKLEKKNGDTWETVKVNVNGVESETITTPTEEENPAGGAGVIIFSNLPSGEYQLTEVKTAPGHTLLTSPIPVTVNKDGNFTYTINGREQTPVDNTIELTIKNGQNLEMPATGGTGPIPFTVGGLSICMIASLMYIESMRKRRKEGKAS